MTNSITFGIIFVQMKISEPLCAVYILITTANNYNNILYLAFHFEQWIFLQWLVFFSIIVQTNNYFRICVNDLLANNIC